MNLLIGIMCNSMAKAVDHEEIKSLLSRAQVCTLVCVYVSDVWVGLVCVCVFVHFAEIVRKSRACCRARRCVSRGCWPSQGSTTVRNNQPAASGLSKLWVTEHPYLVVQDSVESHTKHCTPR